MLVSRHLSRALGKKIASRVRLSPVVMESTHDLDFVLWLLEPAKPVRVYSQGAYGYMEPINGSHDVMFTTVTMDNGVVVMIGGGWNFPESYPNYCSTWIEITGTEGALVSRRHPARQLAQHRSRPARCFPMSTMPGEQVDHVFAGGMGPETIHFIEACIQNRPVMVTPERARMVMETYTAADLSADRNEPVEPAADQRNRRGHRRSQGAIQGGRGGDAARENQAADIGLAIIGAGRGRAVSRRGRGPPSGGASGSASPRRTITARLYVAPRRSAPTSSPRSHRELLKRPEVTCVIIATDEHLHVDPIMGSGRARRADADREAAGDRSRRNPPQRAQGHHRTPSSTRWWATPSASAANGSPPRRRCAPARSAT